LIIDCVHNTHHNAHMGFNWMKQPAKPHKIITVKEIAARYGIHRNTASKVADGVNLYDLWSVYDYLLIRDFELNKLPEKIVKGCFYDHLISRVGPDRAKEIITKYKLD
jgi:hypothetical protein